MKLLSIILMLMICVIAMAFWKDIREMSARQGKSKKRKVKPLEVPNKEVNKQ